MDDGSAIAGMRILSGIQPTTDGFHLGNWLGAVRNWVAYQERAECFYCIVDLHALTTRPKADELARNTFGLAVSLLAVGVDPERSALFVQSAVPEHAELSWILACLTQLGDLNRMTQFKDKAKKDEGAANAGLYTYPVLQAADILLYKATHVPVGEDQEQHLELAREIVRRFHYHYGEMFPEPQVVRSPAPRVLGLDGKTKMSKSKDNYIGITEDPETILAKLRGAVTDPQRLRRSDPGRPEVCNIWALHGSFTPEETRREIHEGCTTAGIGCVDCKRILWEHLTAVTEPIRRRSEELKADPDGVYDVLEDGRRRAAAVATVTMAEVRERLGLWRRR